MKFALYFLAAALSVPCFAGERAAIPLSEKKSDSRSLWDLPKLYENKDNPVLQEFSVNGRLQLQYSTGTSSAGSYGSEDRPDERVWDDAIEVRRWRIGFKSRWFQDFKVEGLFDINPEWDLGVYDKIFFLNVAWEISKDFELAAGKFKANVLGLEHSTSSNDMLTFERSLLSNLVYPGELTGARLKGRAGDYLFTAAVFAGDDEREFTQGAAGHVVQANIGRNFKGELGLKNALVRLEYQYGTDAENAHGGGLFEHVVAINGQFEKDQWAVQAEALYGVGRGLQGDVYGIYVLPTYNITDKLQLVGRYQYASGDHDALRVANRYERLAPNLTDGGRGETYHAAYFGVNYYIYGQKLKLMAGTEYNHMDGGGDGGDFDGWTTTTGVRVSF
jgi:phosphate-selective porin OprO and OprP